jgi:hypothetical protein
MVAGEAPSGHEVGCPRAAGDQRGVVVDHAVMDAVRGVVAVTAKSEQLTRQRAHDLLDGRIVEDDGAGRRNLTFDHNLPPPRPRSTSTRKVVPAMGLCKKKHTHDGAGRVQLGPQTTPSGLLYHAHDMVAWRSRAPLYSTSFLRKYSAPGGPTGGPADRESTARARLCGLVSS